MDWLTAKEGKRSKRKRTDNWSSTQSGGLAPPHLKHTHIRTDLKPCKLWNADSCLELGCDVSVTLWSVEADTWHRMLPRRGASG